MARSCGVPRCEAGSPVTPPARDAGHQQAELLLAGLARRRSPVMRPSNITRMRSDERQDLVELDRDEQDGLAGVAHAR